MQQFYFFPRDSILPSFFANRIQDFVSSLGNLTLRRAGVGLNLVEIPAGANDAAVSLPIQRKWRFIEATVQRAHPGGAAGQYSIWAVAAANSISNAPAPFTDNTNYAFDLRITAVGVPPAASAGVVDIWREIGRLQWDGAQITSITPLVGITPHAITHATGGSDPITPADIGAATTAALAAETAARTAADANNPTANEKAALAGTSGAPANGNRYVTDADARNTNARTPSAHAATHEAAGSDPSVWALAVRTVLDVGVTGQTRAGRVFVPADFTDLGLAAPVLLLNFSNNANDSSGNARNLTNKGAVPFGKGITGAASEAAVLAGSTAQALYRADEAATSIATGSWFGWFRDEKRGTVQTVLSKWRATGNQRSYRLYVTASNVFEAQVSLDGTAVIAATGSSDVCDGRQHFAFATHDGTTLRLYVDGVLEASVAAAGVIFDSSAPLNVGGYDADAGTATAEPFYGRADECGLLAEVATEDQIRLLMSVKLAHGAARTPRRAGLSVRRRRRGAVHVAGDFTALGLLEPERGYNLDSVNDWTTGPVNLTANGGVVAGGVAGPDGKAGGATNFDGVDDNLSATDAGLPAGTATRTLLAWFKTIDTGNRAIIMYGAAIAGQLIRVQVAAGGNIELTDFTNNFLGPFVADGAWHLVVATLDNAAADGVKRKLYLDARLVGADTAFNSTVLAGANGLRIGSDASGGRFWKGQLARVDILAEAMTPDQIVAIYAKGSQDLGLSPYPPGEYVERLDGTNVHVLAERGTLYEQDQVELEVAA